MHRLIQEWRAEGRKGPGVVTRAMLLLAALRDSGKVRTACSACLSGTYRFGKTAEGQVHTMEQAQQVEQLAGELVSEALLRKTRSLRSLARRSDDRATPAGVIRE